MFYIFSCVFMFLIAFMGLLFYCIYLVLCIAYLDFPLIIFEFQLLFLINNEQFQVYFMNGKGRC